MTDKYLPYRTKEEIGKVISTLQNEGWRCGGRRPCGGCGSDYPPYTEGWSESLSLGMDSKFKDGLGVLDLGCGYGRFLNYLYIKEINKFKYYGLELPGPKNGDILIKHNREKYEPFSDSDKKIRFGFVGDEDLTREAVKNCDTLLLGSVFTHVSIEDSVEILKTYEKILEKESGSVVFSLIMGESYSFGRSGCYGYEKGYSHVTHTDKELEKLTLNDKYKIEKVVNFQTDHWAVHTIYKLTKPSK